MAVSVIKMTLRKLPPKLLHYRDYRKFDNSQFINSVHSALSREENEILEKDSDVFFKTCLEVLKNMRLLRKKNIRGNNKPFMTKELSKPFIKKSRIRNLLTEIKNICVLLLRKTKREYFSNLNAKDVTDNKTFWQIVKLLFSDKIKLREKITLAENDKSLSDVDKVAKTLSNFF